MEKQFKEVTEWQQETFGDKCTTVSLARHLIDEVIELRDELMFVELLVRGNYYNIEKELADCFILLFGIANRLGYDHDDLCKFIDNKLAINKQRKWNEPDANGVIKHKED